MLDGISIALEFIFEFLTNDKVRNVAVIAGAWIAVRSIVAARTIAKKKQAADLLFQSRSDPKIQSGYAEIRLHYTADDKNIKSLSSEAKRGSDEAVKIRYLLNHWELVSVGIQADIYDEDMIKKSWYTPITESYTRALPFIEGSRETDKKPTLFQEFEWLAKRWLADPLGQHKPKRRLEFWKK